MTFPESTITLDVSLSNPGQFLACCGLLELANRVDKGALGWFGNKEFFVSGVDRDLFITSLSQCTISADTLDAKQFAARKSPGSIATTPKTLNPVRLGSPFDITLDWWLRPERMSWLKTWSGDKQVPIDIMKSLQKSFGSAADGHGDDTLRALLRQTEVLRLSPFYFSAQKSYHALDVGFSIDKVKWMKIPHGGAVEFLAFVALQRFKPTRDEGQLRLGIWNTPLPVAMAAAVAATLVQPLCSELIEFEIINRDERGHKQFSSARRRQHV